VRAWGDRALADVNSDVTEYIVLFNIGRAPAPGASQAEIARFSDMGSPALVRHIDRLEAEGLVVRTRDEADRRTIRLNLTAAGREHLHTIGKVIGRCDEELRAVLTAQEADVMQRALDKVFAFCLGELYGDEAARHAEPTAPTAPPAIRSNHQPATSGRRKR
jgi:MarR family transcriptional regulator, transcriptional regulator for hemolysin